MSTDPHAIPVQDAAALTMRWRRNRPLSSINGGRFDRVALDNLLSQPGCEGIRIYLGLHDPSDPAHAKDGSLWTFVLVGTDADGNDMIPPQSARTGDSGGGTSQNPVMCPPSCGKPGPLNTPP